MCGIIICLLVVVVIIIVVFKVLKGWCVSLEIYEIEYLHFILKNGLVYFIKLINDQHENPTPKRPPTQTYNLERKKRFIKDPQFSRLRYQILLMTLTHNIRRRSGQSTCQDSYWKKRKNICWWKKNLRKGHLKMS